MGKQCYILPDFIVIGANKAGTTSVANYLNDCPQVGMSRIKEPMFFSSINIKKSIDKHSATLANPYFALNLKEYSELFEHHNPKIVRLYGEASTSYLANPRISAPMIRSIVPDVKLIAILREPIDRVISAYKMTYGNKIETRTLSEIIDEYCKNNLEYKIKNQHGVKQYIENGFYYQLLKIYFDYFPKEKILLLKYDDLKKDPRTFMNKIFHFLRIEPCASDFSRIYNTQYMHLKGKKVVVTDEDRVKLAKIFYNEIKNLLKFIDVSDWLSKYNLIFNRNDKS